MATVIDPRRNWVRGKGKEGYVSKETTTDTSGRTEGSKVGPILLLCSSTCTTDAIYIVSKRENKRKRGEKSVSTLWRV